MSKRKKAETGLGNLDDLLGGKVQATSPSTSLQERESANQQIDKPTNRQIDKSGGKPASKRISPQSGKPKRKAISVYVSPQVAMRLEMAKPQAMYVTGESGLSINKSTITEAALIYLLNDFDANGNDSFLADYIRRYAERIKAD